MDNNIIEENDTLSNSLLANMMEESIEIYPFSIFICRLVNNGTHKVKIKEEQVIKLLKNNPKALQKYPHLMDNDKNPRLYRHSIGYLLPMKELKDTMDLIATLKEERKKMNKDEEIYIKLSNKSPFSISSDVKVQFRNITCEIKKDTAKKAFCVFGKIRECYEVNGVWEILYMSLNEHLPFLYSEHAKEKENRWFRIFPNVNAEASFTSRKTCSQCKIKGHEKSTCPGKPLLIKLGIYKEPIITKSKNPSGRGKGKKKESDEEEEWLPNNTNSSKGRGRGRGKSKKTGSGG